MNIVKSLHSSLLYKSFSFQEKHYFTVSVLWGFNLQTGEPVLEQDLWQTIGEMLGKNELFDAGMPKSNAELLVHGSCFSADNKAVNASRASISLGEISKELFVFGDRHWIKGLGIGWGLSEPEPFTEMPISYANAFGGAEHTSNPVGKGIDEVEGDTGQVIPVPNIEYANQLIGSPKDKPRPASFNRTDLMCEQRMSNAGTYDQNYIETRMPGFPDDLNFDYFNDAAIDQQITGYFKGDEHYEIRNMHPDHATIKGQIPGIYGRAFVNQKINNKVEFKEIPTNLDTVWLFPSAGLGVLIHRGTLDVSEDDASDIKQLLVANENSKDTPREISHYHNEIVLRTNPEESYKYLLYTSPLIPVGCTCGFQAMQDNNDFPLESLASENMENYSNTKQQEVNVELEQQLDTMKKQMEDSGLDQQKVDEMIKQVTDAKNNPAAPSSESQELKAIMEKVLPGAMDDPKNVDLSKLNLKAMDEFNAYVEKMQKDNKDEAKTKLVERLDELKKQENSPETENSIKQIEKLIIELDLPPILPRVNAEEVIEQYKGQMAEMEKQLLVMQSMGMSAEELAKIKSSLDIDDAEKQACENVATAVDGYRVGAHYIEESRSPHKGQENDIREALINAYKSGAKTANGDYAFVDLSGLDLTGIDFSGAYLEYANLTNTNLTNANLSKAIMPNAIFNNTNLFNANFTEANLGSIDFDGAMFTDTDLTGVILGKSNIKNTTFKNCKMAEKMDMFLEATFDKASFVDSDMHKNVFIDLDFSGSSFKGSNLADSNFVNPIMKNVDFSLSILNGVNFVKAVGDASVFDGATMKNVRFVGESSLANTTFISADASEANLRDCNLTGSKFTEATLHKTDFSGSDLTRANFEKARAVEVQFAKSDLTHASMQKIDMMEGSLYKAILSGAMFNNANLYNVNFMGCTVGQTDFTGAYLEQTIFKDWRP